MVRTAVAAASLLASGLAAATLVVTPLTWNIVGLDSNNPATGPRYFPVGARICSSTATTNVVANFVWDSANANINTRPGSLTSITVPTLAAGACTDAYFEIEVTQTPAAFDTTRRYRITATDGTGTVSTPVPREIYVERLVSQARNEVSDVQLNGVSVLPGGTMTLMVGGTYDIKLVGATATQGYNQLESFINFPNTIFRVLAVSTTYTADSSNFVSSPNDRLYADACGWENHPSSPNYRSCVGVAGVGSDGKAGGGVVTTYTVQVVSGAGTTQPLNTLIYDFSGSSFHYNGDYAVGARLAQIVASVSPTFAKAFAPSTVLAGGSTVLTLSIGNANPTALTNVAFIDVLPASPAQLLIAAAPAPILSGCGAATLTATAGTATISLANASVAANSSCTVSVPIVVPAAPLTGSYNNITGPLSVNGTATTITASATLNAINSPPPSPGACSSTVDIARWTMDAGQGLGVPPAPSYINPLAAAATASFSGSNSILSGTGSPANSWGGTGWNDAGIPTSGVGPYFQVSADTSKFYGVRVVFDANPAVAGDWGNAGNNSVYVWSSADGGAYSSPLTGFPLAITKNTWTAGLSGTAAATGTSTTAFRVSINGANKVAATFALDNIRIVGCAYPSVPTLTKAFAPNPIRVGGTSTLTFTLTNPNTVPLTSAAFADQLPAGVVVAPTVSAVSTCGSPTWAPSAGASTLSFSGGTIPASGSCTASVNVTATSAGAKLNISDFITTTQSGANTTSSGVATATLNVDPIILPPVAAKSFAPAAVVAGQTSILTITLQNPNTTTTLTSAQLVDIYPGDLLNANPLLPAVINGCGGTLTVAAGGSGFSLVGVSLAPNASCSIEIPVAAATVGAKVNTTTAPQSIEGGPGTAASATLTVGAAAPALSLSKRVGGTAAGPWFDFAVVAPTGPVYYQFTVENVGNVPFTSFSVSDPLLAGSGADPVGCVWNTINAPSTLPGLPVATATLDPTAVCVRGPVPATTGAVVNTATATGIYNAANYTNVDDATYVGADPNLSLIKEISTSVAGPWTDSIASIASGASVYYRFTVINNGAQSVTGLSIADAMVSTASCAYVDPLPMGEASICVAGPVTTAGAPGATVTNTATVNGTSGGSSVTDTDTANYTLTPPSADVSVVKTLTTAGPFLVGQSISYSLAVANAGPDTATSVLIADTPTNLSITGVVGGGCTALPCTIASLASGVSATITVTATINAAGAFDNAATVSATEFDPVPSNNTDNTGNDGTASAAADVSVVKTLTTAGPYLVGQSISYSLTVANAGPSTATSVLIADTPTNLSITGVVGGGCTALPCLVGVFSPGNSFSITVTATINAAGTFDNSATVAATEFDPVLSNNIDNTDNGGTAVAPSADLSITKTDGTATATPGGSLVYTIVASNAGPNGVLGATVADTFPATLTGVTWTCVGAGGGVCPASGSGNLSAAVDLPAGGSVTFTVNTTVLASASGTLTNTAVIALAGGVTDPNPANNSATDTDSLTPLADLSITKTNGLATVTPGGAVVYTIVASNAGPSNAPNAVVVDTFPASLSSVSWTCAAAGGASCPAAGAGNLSAAVDLPAGSSVTFTVTATLAVGATGTLSNTSTVSPPSGVSDPNPANNSATDADTIVPATLVADVSIVKNVPLTILAGGQVTYSITVTNAGPDPAANAVWSDTLPAELTYVSMPAVAGWNCAVAGQIVSCTATGPLAAGYSATFQLTAALGTATPPASTITNTATVTTTTSDPSSANNTSSGSSQSTAQVDVGVTKTNGVTQLVTGSTFSYTIVASNSGPSAAQGATLTDTPGIGLTVNSWTCAVTTPGSGGGTTSCSAASGSGAPSNVALNLRVGGAVTFTVSATVTAAAGGSVSNQARIVEPPSTTEVNPGNNTATDVDNVVSAPINADLAVTKTNNAASVTTGTATSYVIRVTNNGPDAVTGAVLSDPQAPGLTKTAIVCSPTPGACVTPPTVAELEGLAFALPALASGGFHEIVVTANVTAPAGGSVTNTVTATAPAGVTDNDLNNNTASDTDPVVAAPATVADLAVTKTNGTAQVTAGQTSTYTMVITNNGPEAAPNATLTDTLPAQMTFTSLTAPGGWNCTTPAVGTAGAVSCSTPSMAAGVTATFVLSVTVVPSTPGGSTISNTVNVNSGASDPVLSNNQATDTDTVIVAPVTADLAIAKSNGGTQLVAGGSTTYTLTVTNLGPDEVAGAVVTDIAPAGLAFASWTCTVTNPGAGGSVTTACVTGSGMGNVNATVNLKAGAVATFSVAATVASNAGGSIGNTATINAPPGVTDPALGNNTATDTDTIAVGPPPVVEVPTLSEWALAVMSLFLAVVAMRSMRVRRR